MEGGGGGGGRLFNLSAEKLTTPCGLEGVQQAFPDSRFEIVVALGFICAPYKWWNMRKRHDVHGWCMLLSQRFHLTFEPLLLCPRKRLGLLTILCRQVAMWPTVLPTPILESIVQLCV